MLTMTFFGIRIGKSTTEVGKSSIGVGKLSVGVGKSTIGVGKSTSVPEFQGLIFSYQLKHRWEVAGRPFKKAPLGKEIPESANLVENRARTGSGNDAKT